MTTIITTDAERDVRDAGYTDPTPEQVALFAAAWIAAAERIAAEEGMDITAYANGGEWTHTIDDPEWDDDQWVWQRAHDSLSVSALSVLLGEPK